MSDKVMQVQEEALAAIEQASNLEQITNKSKFNTQVKYPGTYVRNESLPPEEKPAWSE